MYSRGLVCNEGSRSFCGSGLLPWVTDWKYMQWWIVDGWCMIWRKGKFLNPNIALCLLGWRCTIVGLMAGAMQMRSSVSTTCAHYRCTADVLNVGSLNETGELYLQASSIFTSTNLMVNGVQHWLAFSAQVLAHPYALNGHWVQRS